MSFSVILDLIMVVLLLSGTIAAIILSWKLSSLRKSKKEIHHFMEILARSLVEAKNTLDQLEVISSHNAQELQDKVRLVKSLRRDLEISIAKAEKMTSLSKQPAQIRPPAPSAAQRMSQPTSIMKSSSQQRVEPKLAQALRDLS